MLKSTLFKLKKNRRYNYTPRYYKGKEEVAKELMNDEEEGGNGCIQQ